MVKYSNFDSVMGPETISNNRMSLKSLTGRDNILMSIRLFLLIFSLLLAGCTKPALVEVSSHNFDELVKIEVKILLDIPSLFISIKQYQWETIQTPIETFKEIAKKNGLDGATLHPNLTCKILYLDRTLLGVAKEKQCDAMVYTVVKDGKLHRCGMVFSECLGQPLAKIWTIDSRDYSKDYGTNWTVWIIFSIVFGFLCFFLYARPHKPF